MSDLHMDNVNRVLDLLHHMGNAAEEHDVFAKPVDNHTIDLVAEWLDYQDSLSDALAEDLGLQPDRALGSHNVPDDAVMGALAFANWHLDHDN